METEGASLQSNNGPELSNHILRNKTPGHVTHIIWNKEESLLEHQYLLIGVTLNDATSTSWIRVERMGDLGGSSSTSNGTKKEEAGLVLTLAPTPRDLVNYGDTTISDGNLGQAAYLTDVVKLITIVHDEASQYSLLHHNCWWFARLLLRILVEKFMPDGQMKNKVLGDCFLQNLAHAEAPYYSPRLGRRLRRGLLFVTLPVFPIAYPVIIGGSMVVCATTLINLRLTRKRAATTFEYYLAQGICH